MRHAGIENMAELLEKQLASELSKMTLEEALTLARAFSHHLTLMGIAETHHRYQLLLLLIHCISLLVLVFICGSCAQNQLNLGLMTTLMKY